MKYVLRSIGIAFLCAHQTPHGDNAQYGNYWHMLKHKSKILNKIGLGNAFIPGFASPKGIHVNRGSKTHKVSGFVCGDCGHVSHGCIVETDPNTTSDSYIYDRVKSNLWMTDTEWCEVNTKNKT